jgi:outer membrane protein
MKTIKTKQNVIRLICMIVLLIFSINQHVSAQEKTGYLNLNELIYSMPEIKTIGTEVDAYQKQFVDQLASMNNEFQTKAQIYETQKAKLTDAIRTAKEAELADLQKRMTDYENNARQQVAQKSNELMKPVVDKVMAAIAAVAKEKGYHMILDSASGNIAGKSILYAPDADDVTTAVKDKLGIK